MARRTQKPGPSPALDLNELLLHSKALEPLSAPDQARLKELQAADITGWTEADVRGEIIDPLVRLLGYRKGDVFSVDRERAVEFRDSRRFIDYAATVWSENFWLIEAKRPQARRRGFSQADLDQALRYAIHPDINAALVVLTDGDLWEVFDRETSVARPILQFRRRDLIKSFDQLRGLLGPWQAWFLERRRIVRLVDRVFDHEVNLGRVREFRDQIDRRLEEKRGRILDNMRALKSLDADGAQRRAYFSRCDIDTLVDVHLFQSLSLGDLDAVANRLVALSRPGAFDVLRRMLGDTPRDANHLYWPHVLRVLIALDEAGFEPNWLPAWLGIGQSSVPLENAIAKLIELCLTYFEPLPGHRAVLLWSASAKRQFKVMAHTNPSMETHARQMHALNRFIEPELSFQQIIASADGQLLGAIARQTMVATANFVTSCHDERGKFQVGVAKEGVRRMLEGELRLVQSVPHYAELWRDRGLTDFTSVEAAAVTWDELAHGALCLVADSPRWRAHLLSEHDQMVRFFARQGYWSARHLLGEETRGPEEATPSGWTAERFFFGDEGMAERLAAAYRQSPQ